VELSLCGYIFINFYACWDSYNEKTCSSQISPAYWNIYFDGKKKGSGEEPCLYRAKLAAEECLAKYGVKPNENKEI